MNVIERRRSPGVVLIAVAVAATIAASSGCRFSSVDRDLYVEANEAIFEQLPSFPGARVTSQTSHPYRDSENGPVVGYTTLALLSLPRGATPETVAAFFEARLSPEWRLVERLDGPVLNFHRGDAAVSINLESWRSHVLEIAVDRAGT